MFPGKAPFSNLGLILNLAFPLILNSKLPGEDNSKLKNKPNT